jgi:Helix-turn-helix domain
MQGPSNPGDQDTIATTRQARYASANVVRIWLKGYIGSTAMLPVHSIAPATSTARDRGASLSQLGVRLYRSRTQLGISLREAADTTRILACYLAALEVGAYHRLPSQVCARGFIRIYADYLDIPVEELIELYQCEYGMPEPIRIEPAIGGPQIGKRWLCSFLGASCVVLLLVAGSYLVLSALS